jgi:hypothetical protein
MTHYLEELSNVSLEASQADDKPEQTRLEKVVAFHSSFTFTRAADGI